MPTPITRTTRLALVVAMGTLILWIPSSIAFTLHFFTTSRHVQTALSAGSTRSIPITQKQSKKNDTTTTSSTHRNNNKNSTKHDDDDENDLFQTNVHVGYWKTLQSHGNAGQDAQVMARFLVSALQSKNPVVRAYWSSFMARTVFFGVNGVVGNLLAETRGVTSLVGVMDFSFRVFELIQCYQQELTYIQQGRLKYPWDFLVQVGRRRRQQQQLHVQWKHRQAHPFFVISESIRQMQETPLILERLTKFQGKPSGTVWMTSFRNQRNRRKPAMYPQYYLNDFHYQSEGWLSSESAKRYEMSSELVFIGSQDVMQRQTILPLTTNQRYSIFGTTMHGGPSSILEVACGTGRFSTFVRDHFPAAEVTLVDLSPFYLEKAKDNDCYWREYRGKYAMKESTGTWIEPSPATFVQANAEDLPFANDSFEVVLCVYLFHELPLAVRKKVVQEMARVVQPGGTIVFTDSIQSGDRQGFDGNLLDGFGKLNEPHYVSYQRTDLAALFVKCGLECDQKHVNSQTKTLSFTKPASTQ
jgi:ubiquinone/menaquinone biosynthesis C-methylase UbiE